jgi:hypothetical protein
MQRAVEELSSGLVIALSVGFFLSIIGLANLFVVFDIVLGALGASERTIGLVTAVIWFVSVWLVGLKVVASQTGE